MLYPHGIHGYSYGFHLGSYQGYSSYYRCNWIIPRLSRGFLPFPLGVQLGFTQSVTTNPCDSIDAVGPTVVIGLVSLRWVRVGSWVFGGYRCGVLPVTLLSIEFWQLSFALCSRVLHRSSCPSPFLVNPWDRATKWGPNPHHMVSRARFPQILLLFHPLYPLKFSCSCQNSKNLYQK